MCGRKSNSDLSITRQGASAATSSELIILSQGASPSSSSDLNISSHGATAASSYDSNILNKSATAANSSGLNILSHGATAASSSDLNILSHGATAASSSGLNILSHGATASSSSAMNILSHGATAASSSDLNMSHGATASSSSAMNILNNGETSSSSLVFDNIQSNRYDVFISFRGSDTRNTFVDHLYAHLTGKGIFTFKDDTQLHKGESISTQLRHAIKNSRVSIVVFSEDYPTSTWCLDEMTTIVNCCRNAKQIALPIFYDVDPSHVRKQNGVYKNAFDLHTKTFESNPHKVDGWKRDMTYLAEHAGYDIRNKPEFQEIKNIVESITKKLDHRFLPSLDDLIGIQPHIEELESLLKLRLESDDDDGCQVLGLWGMDGIGKTTLAKVLYDRISYQFDASCFIENVSKSYEDGGAITVQKQIIHQTIKEFVLEGYSPSQISGVITRLYNMKVLIVLDDVDQLLELQINLKMLRPGSRVIITTRDVHILELYEADTIHEIGLMNDNDARELLCRKAFKSDHSSSDYAELIPKVLKYAQGLPLAIRVMGSFLYKRNTTQWRATLEGLENNPDSGIMKVLQSSFEGLQPREREIFLHIACFFDGEREDFVKRILHACGLQPDIGIPVIAEKSFISIRNQEIHMHKMLQVLGKKIVREQHPQPSSWSRLWLYSDFYDAMITQPVAIKAEAIIINQKEEEVSKFNELSGAYLSKMGNLKVLILYHSTFSKIPLSLSNSLRYLLWNGYPFKSLPNFNPYKLVEFNMPDSNIEQLWTHILELPYLKRMDLSKSKNLMTTPSFEGMKNLERLDLTGCITLSTVHPSIGVLTKLVFLSLQQCINLVSLDFGNAPRLSSLRVLRLSDCTKLKHTPDFSEMLLLQYLDMDRCASLFTIHKSIGALAKLKFLSLRECKNLFRLPDDINILRSLTTLDLYGCSKFTKLPLGQISTSPLQSLVYLDLSFCNITIMPDIIGELSCLERLNLQGNKFTALPSTLSCLHNLSYLNLSHCHRLQSFPELPIESGRSDLAGRYFKTTSESRNHRSGLYIFDSANYYEGEPLILNQYMYWLFTTWVIRLVKEPLHYRCGFDIIFPWHVETNGVFSELLFHFLHCFKGDSIVRINSSVMGVDWVGFLFCVTFESNNHNHQSPSSSWPRLPCPFYLSFESEHTEERFDMRINLELNQVQGRNYIWMIFISREHCHFVETGAHITFKGCKGLVIKEWGLCVITNEDAEDQEWRPRTHLDLQVLEVEESNSGNVFEPKIQLPYNWLVSDQDETETVEAKGKETDLFNLGLYL